MRQNANVTRPFPGSAAACGRSLPPALSTFSTAELLQGLLVRVPTGALRDPKRCIRRVRMKQLQQRIQFIVEDGGDKVDNQNGIDAPLARRPRVPSTAAVQALA